MNTNAPLHPQRLFVPGLVWAALLALCGLIGCSHQSESREKPVPLRDINAVMEEHSAELMAIPGVTGVAIGELDDHTPCILIMVETEADTLKVIAPKMIEGHPTRFYVLGKIVPMNGE